MGSRDHDRSSIDETSIPEKILEQISGNREIMQAVEDLYLSRGTRPSPGGGSRNIRVLIGSGNDILREGMVTVIKRAEGLAPVGEADSASDCIEKADSLAPDVVIMDFHLPGISTFEACAEIKSRHPAMKIIFLSTFNDYKYINKSLKAGADGFLPDRVAGSELVGSIRSVSGGDRAVSPRVLEALIDRILEQADGRWSSILDRLTERELEVLELVSEGLRNKDIAARLFVSLRTVEKTTSDIYRKLGVDSRGAAIRIFLDSNRELETEA